MNLKNFLTSLFALFLLTSNAAAQNYVVVQRELFRPQNKRVLLLKDSASQRKIILFQTNLRVNTDGSPLSYHPMDPRGREKALNNVCNGIAVRRTNSDQNLCFTRFGEAISIFEKWRDSNFQTVPAGFRITWQNVFASVKENGKDVPCVFKSGEFKGYFGSLTRLQNGLSGDSSECQLDNQINPMTTPALVLVGGQSVVKLLGARVGDLLVAFNPKTQLFTAAVIGDTGPPDNLGEGSVSLNMKLRGTTTAPTNKEETFRLSIPDQVLIAIIPASNAFQPATPFTADNINQRVLAWQREAGFETPEKFVEFMKTFQTRL